MPPRNFTSVFDWRTNYATALVVLAWKTLLLKTGVSRPRRTYENLDQLTIKSVLSVTIALVVSHSFVPVKCNNLGRRRPIIVVLCLCLHLAPYECQGKFSAVVKTQTGSSATAEIARVNGGYDVQGHSR